MRRHFLRVVALALVAFAAAPAGAVTRAPADTMQAREGFVSRRDITRLLFATAAIAIVSHRDQELSEDAVQANGPFARGLARAGEHFGNPVYSAPALAALWAVGKLDRRPGLSASVLRIAGGVAASVVVAGGIKESVGRWRPSESPDNASKFSHFSGHSSFPSGHTTVAFALASGIDQETHARWVPWVVYPLAGVTAWSRLRDHEHWSSDVVAGAVVGLWATEKFRLVLGQREHPARHAQVGLSLVPMPAGGPLAAGIAVRF